MTGNLPLLPTSLLTTIAIALTAVHPSAGQTPAGLRRAEPVVCTHTDDVVLRERYIETAGNGVVVKGPCDVEIIGSHIKAAGIAVLINGTGDVDIYDSIIEGGGGGLVINGTGDISYRNTTVVGGTRVAGTGEIVDLGGNRVSGAATTQAIGTTVVLPGIRVEGDRVQVGDVVVDAGGVSIGDGEETVKIDEGGRVTVRSRGEMILVDGDYVRLESGAETIEVSGNWRAASSRYRASDTERLLVELDATEVDGQIQLNLAGDVLFDSDSSAIRADAAEQLAKAAHVLRQRAGSEIHVLGHTDSIGSDDHNQKLSEARAVAVMRWLNRHEGIPVGLMHGRGMGETSPIDYNTMPNGSDNPQGRARNRRVEIRFAQ